MAQSSYNTVLKYSSTLAGTYAKLCDIKDFPDLGSSPETIETTTLSDKRKTYILGLQDKASMEFTANYDLTTYGTIKALATNTTYFFKLYFGEDGAGADGVFGWSGEIDVYVKGAGTNAVREMVVVLSCGSDVVITTA